MTFGMDSALYWKLSALMFLEFAVWGAWYPVLAARLLGPLKFSGKQTGWIYAALPLACIFMPLLAGQMADKYVNTEYILASDAAAKISGSVFSLGGNSIGLYSDPTIISNVTKFGEGPWTMEELMRQVPRGLLSGYKSLAEHPFG